jgi:hypothetical protein
MQKVAGSMSTKTGVAPVRATELAVAAKVKGEGRHEDLVAAANPGGEKAEVESGRSGADGHAGSAADELIRELPFKRRDFRTLGDHA